MSSSTAPAKARPLLMIPGPIEFDAAVLAKLGEPTPGHISAGFIEEFGSSLQLLRTVFRSGANSQPFILSGSGTLGWELVAANLLEARGADAEGADVLVANTGYFSDSWKDCFESFSLRVAQVAAPALGDTVSAESLVAALQANPSVRLVALTQVDTSTGVLNDIGALSRAVKAARPDVLVAVDGVCSFGGETFLQEEWGVDAALTCSQKAIGCPPGLCILMLSGGALKRVEERQTRVPSYYANLRNWLPIMRAYEARTPSYFATPAVNLIRALRVALGQIEAQGIEKRCARHAQVSRAFKAAVAALGLKEVPTASSHAANTLSAVYYPTGAGVDASKLLPAMVAAGVVCAGGLHKEIKALYFRVGHMGVSVNEGNDDVRRVVQALEQGLTAAGAQFKQGAGVDAFDAVLKA